jgi:DNA-binding transcriptional ArsR family regulator
MVEAMRMNEVFKALSDPTRREILKLLRRGELTAGELAERVSKRVSKPSMSHHFAVLREADLIASRREGQQIYYSLNTTVAEDLVSIVWDLFSDGREPQKEPGP